LEAAGKLQDRERLERLEIVADMHVDRFAGLAERLALISAWREAGDEARAGIAAQRALALAHERLQAGASPMSLQVDELAELVGIEPALTLTEAIAEERERREALGFLAQRLVRLGDHQRALELTRGAATPQPLKGDTDQVAMWAAIGAALNDVGAPE